MKKIYTYLITSFVVLSAVLLTTSDVKGQCACSVSDYGSISVAGWTAGQTGTITTCQWGGERATISGTVAGAIYRISSCGASYDTQLSIYTTGCTYLTYNDDNGPACSGLQASVDVTSPGGNLYSVFNMYNCTTEQTCATVTITLLSLPSPPPPVDPCTGCNIAAEGGIAPTPPAGCNNTSTNFGSGAYRDLSVQPNTYYDFSWSNGGATNINGFCATPQNGGASAFTTNQTCWFSGSTSILRVSANRSNCSWTTTSATLTYRHSDPSIAANTPANSAICEGNSVTIAGAAASCGTNYWQGTNNNGTSTATPGLSNSTGTLTTSGTYTYYYRPENNGCWGSQQATVVTVTPASVPPTSAVASPASLCPGGSVTLSVIGGSLGTGDSWTWYAGGCGSGGIVGTGASISVAPSATTTYFVRAEGGCITSACASVQVVVNTLSSAPTSITATNLNVCSGTSTTLTVNGGSLGTGADWRWYIGSCGGQLVGGGPSITVSPQSTANYFVRAEGPCNTTTCASVIISVTPSPTVGFSGIQSPSACGGSDGTITAIANGGNPPYSFSWSNGPLTATNPGLSAGPYIVTVTDASGCTDQSSVSINDPNASVVTLISSDPDQTICAGDVVTFTASGAFQYQYYVNGIPTVTQNPWVTNTLVDGDQVSVLGIDYNFCAYTAPGIVFTVHDKPVINATVTDPTSCGGSDGAITTGVTSGLQPYSYAWVPTASTPDITGLPAGPYFLTVTDLNGCSAQGTYGLSDPGADPVTITSSEQPNNVICAGEQVTFTASGSQNYEFFAFPVSVGNANPYITTTLTDGQSVVATGIDANGCTATSNIIITTVNPGPLISLLSNVLNETICVGQDISFFASGGVIYEFFVNTVSQGPASATSLFIGTGLNNGDVVTVLGTDANGCDVQSSALTVTVNPSPVAIIVSQQDPSDCGATDGEVVAGATGGTTPYDYQWAAGPNADTYSGLAAGSYYVTVTDGAGCTSSVSASLSDVGSSPVFLTSDYPGGIVCGGLPVSFTATGATTYVYYVNGVLTSTSNPFVTTTLQDGDIIAVTGLDTQLCAATSAPVQFTIHPEITIGIVSSLNPSGCQATDGAANTITIGGTPAYNYLWTDGQITPNASGLPAGQWTVTVTDANGCSDYDVVSLSDIGATVATLTPDPSGTTICEGIEVTFTASGSFQYEFFLDGNSVGTANPYVNSALQNGQTVALVATDVNGCVYTTPGLNYTVNPAPLVILPSVGPACSNDDVIELFGGLPNGGVYSVDYVFNGNTFPTITNLFFPDLAGAGVTNVNYLFTNSNGCVGSASALLTVHAAPVVDLGNDTTACVYDLDAGAGFVSYLWCTSNATTQTFTSTETGNYCVRVEDSNGCFGYDTVLVVVLPIPNVSLTPNSPVEFCEGNSVTVSVESGFNSYTWTSGTATMEPNVQVIDQAGPFSVTVIDANGCIAVVDAEAIENIPMAVPGIEVIGTEPFCYGGSVVLQVESGYASYLWNTGSTTSAITVTQSGSYWLSTLDGNGCIDSSTQAAPVDILVWNPLPLVDVVGSTLIVTNADQFVSFQWLLNNNPIPGATQSEYAINPTGSGNYTVQVVDANDCVGTSQVFELTCCVGIEDADFDGSVSIYPNPNNGAFMVDIALNTSRRMTVEMFDMVGKTIWTDAAIGITDQLRKQYDINDLPNGIYFLRVTADTQMNVIKVIKQ
ncbi:MAG: T9SS type A sorting domain-containing protein [Flavobacteriales bacterium]|nr:T9SS type A sorting domain-containing protein [Flavobacteriales bacterium]